MGLIVVLILNTIVFPFQLIEVCWLIEGSLLTACLADSVSPEIRQAHVEDPLPTVDTGPGLLFWWLPCGLAHNVLDLLRSGQRHKLCPGLLCQVLSWAPDSQQGLPQGARTTAWISLALELLMPQGGNEGIVGPLKC